MSLAIRLATHPSRRVAKPFWAAGLASVCLGLSWAALAQAEGVPLPPPALNLALTQLRLPAPEAGAAALPELSCPAQAPRPAPKPPAPEAEVLDVPDADTIDAALQDAAQQAAAGQPQASAPGQDKLDGVLRGRNGGGPLRIAIWGDSHLAAGFFTDTLLRQTGLPPERIHTGFVPGSINRAGIRLASVRKSCLSAGWRHEPGYVSAHAGAPGPGLVNLNSAQAGAWFALDLRNAAGTPERQQLRLLYQQTAEPLQIALSVDDGPERLVDLAAPAGPAALELLAQTPISLLRLRLVQGSLRWHGLSFAPNPNAALQMDVFGYPGATANGWKQADSAYLGAWFQTQRYDVVMLEYGTNEGNDRQFNPDSYRQSLRQAVGRMTTMFPEAACVLIAPGDRGVLVRRSLKKSGKKGKANKTSKAVPARAGKAGKAGKTAQAAQAGKTTKAGASGKTSAKQAKRASQAAGKPSAPKANTDLLRFARIHAEIGRLQHSVADEYGCKVWSMQTAMGGQGSAYQWVRQSPPLMARDLIHFTAAGYQQLARQLFLDLGWDSLNWRQAGRPPLPSASGVSLSDTPASLMR